MMMALIITRKLSFEQCSFCSVSIQTTVHELSPCLYSLTAMTVRRVVLIPGPTTVGTTVAAHLIAFTPRP
jgi:hypothetical protein